MTHITKSIGLDDNCSGGSCPSLHVTNDGKIVVQGALASKEIKGHLTIPSHEDVVVFDRASFEALAKKLSTQG